jgi:hypothetical protein
VADWGSCQTPSIVLYGTLLQLAQSVEVLVTIRLGVWKGDAGGRGWLL